MAKIKSYTDLNQSKKLAEFLPLGSADMWWLYITAQGKRIAMMHDEPDPHYLARMESYGIKDAAIRCWSLSALLNVLPMIDFTTPQLVGTPKTLYRCMYNDNLKSPACDNAVDACYEMILKLYELKML